MVGSMSWGAREVIYRRMAFQSPSPVLCMLNTPDPWRGLPDTLSGAKFKGYGWCPTRACAQERVVSSCGLCPEWTTCERVSESIGESSEARANLEKIAQSTNKSVDGNNQ